jgi:hypothetical protein
MKNVLLFSDGFWENAPIIGAFLSMVIFFSIPCFAEYNIHIPLWVGFLPLGSIWLLGLIICTIGSIIDFFRFRKNKEK